MTVYETTHPGGTQNITLVYKVPWLILNSVSLLSTQVFRSSHLYTPVICDSITHPKALLRAIFVLLNRPFQCALSLCCCLCISLYLSLTFVYSLSLSRFFPYLCLPLFLSYLCECFCLSVCLSRHHHE